MPDSSPAARLRAAAARLREASHHATGDLPWEAELMQGEKWAIFAPRAGFAGEDDLFAVANVQGDADWITTMSPVVAEPLAVWLDTEARKLDYAADQLLELPPSPALAVADAILGDTEKGDDDAATTAG